MVVAGLLELGTQVDTPYGVGIVEKVRQGYLDLREGEQKRKRYCYATIKQRDVTRFSNLFSDDAAPLPPVSRRSSAACAAGAGAAGLAGDVIAKVSSRRREYRVYGGQRIMLLLCLTAGRSPF